MSRHLALLHQAGAVARRRERASVYYRVADPELLAICRSVCMHIAACMEAAAPLRAGLLALAAAQAP